VSQKPLEKDVQRQVKGIYKQFGCSVYDFSQPRATMQTAGIPDLLIFHESSKTFWFMEVKRDGGKQTQNQLDFERRVQWCGGVYILGGVAEALKALREIAGIKIHKEI